MSIPFHKQTDPNKQAGQIVNPLPEQFLHQYIERKTDKEDLNFVKWFAAYNEKYGLPPAYIVAKAAWEAALSNGKVS